MTSKTQPHARHNQLYHALFLAYATLFAAGQKRQNNVIEVTPFVIEIQLPSSTLGR
jgi:hypothetical protein